MSVLAGDKSDATDESGVEAVPAWLQALETALGDAGGRGLDDLLLENACWRDLVALSWDTCQYWSRDAIREVVPGRAAASGLHNLRPDPERSPARTTDFLGERVVEVFFAFDTAVGTGKGFARLVPDPSSALRMRAMMVATSLVRLDCASEPEGRHPRTGFEPAAAGQSWRDWAARKSDFRHTDPDVMVIGGSQSGLSVGARFERKGIPYLIVERNENPGDQWRNRYDALVLHTPTPMNHLPYIPLPDTWPMFLSKDQWADWLDCYAKLMNLNLWTSTEVLGAKFEHGSRRWSVLLRTPSGEQREMRPSHLVLALGGVGGAPRIPELPGLADFAGPVTHSSTYRRPDTYRGQRVLVVGSSTTAHDICLDLHHGEAMPTMAQRGATCVVNISEVLRFAADYSVLPVDEADQMRSAMSLPLMIRRAQAATRMSEASHADLHSGLRKAGQKLTIGHDQTGWSMKLFRDLAGYYLNVGASEAIIEGHIKMLDFDEIARFTADGVILGDGSAIPFDAVILATGYNDVSDSIAGLLGPDVAARIGRCIGVAEDGEYRSMSRPVAHPHLWLINGGIVDSRKASDLLAIQVIAQLRGLAPSLDRQPDGTVQAI